MFFVVQLLKFHIKLFLCIDNDSTTVESILIYTLINKQLYLWPPSQKPVFLTPIKISLFFLLHSPKRRAPVVDTLFAFQGCPLTVAFIVYQCKSCVKRQNLYVRKHKLNRFTMYMKCEIYQRWWWWWWWWWWFISFQLIYKVSVKKLRTISGTVKLAAQHIKKYHHSRSLHLFGISF